MIVILPFVFYGNVRDYRATVIDVATTRGKNSSISELTESVH